MNRHRAAVDSAVSRFGVSGTLIRLPSTRVVVKAANRAYTEADIPSGAQVTQTRDRWLLSDTALKAAGFPLPVREGDRLSLAGVGAATITAVAPRVAGEVVGWDVTVTGAK